MEQIVEEAFRIAIVAEKKSHDLYLQACAMIPEGSEKAVLQRLADDQETNLFRIVERCPYPVQHLIEEPERLFSVNDYPQERRLVNLLRVALNDKYACVARYETYLEAFREPAVYQVFQLAREMSSKLLRRISEEYRQANLRQQRPCVNRRTKRAHIKPCSVARPAPNKHSQPFFSLLDFGRQFPL